MTPVAILLGAVLWDILLGEMPSGVHPVVWMGRFISALWARRPRGERALFLFGTGLVLSGGGLVVLAAASLRRLPTALEILLSIPLLKASLSISGLLRAGRGVLSALEAGNLPEARRRLSRDLVSRSTEDLTEGEVAGAAVESLAENLTDSLASPLFFFLLFGLPGALFYRFVNTCDSMIGYRTGDMEWGGKFAARSDDLLNWLPARVSALVLLVAGGVLGADRRGGSHALRGERGGTASPNAGWTMSVMAGLLGVTLEKRGAYRLAGGDGFPDEAALTRAIKITAAASALLCALAVLWEGFYGFFH